MKEIIPYVNVMREIRDNPIREVGVRDERHNPIRECGERDER